MCYLWVISLVLQVLSLSVSCCGCYGYLFVYVRFPPLADLFGKNASFLFTTVHPGFRFQLFCCVRTPLIKRVLGSSGLLLSEFRGLHEYE